MTDRATNRKIVVITPVKNEDWVLEAFLSAASTYADHIVLGDHNSTDRTLQIARAFPKVRVISSDSGDFTEAQRRNELLIAARDYGPENLIIALDADELLTPDSLGAGFFDPMLENDAGTRFKIPHLNVFPGWRKYWRVPMAPVAFIDDGSLHDLGNKIHFPRIPERPKSKVVNLSSLGMIHLQYLDWKRMECKHEWYRTWERINFPKKSQLEIVRRYSHMYLVPSWKYKPVPRIWIETFAKHGVDLVSLGGGNGPYWWARESERLRHSHPEVDFSLMTMEVPLTPKQANFKRYLEITRPLAKLNWLLPARLLLRVLDRAFSGFFK